MQASGFAAKGQVIIDLKTDEHDHNRIAVTLDNGITFSVGLRRSATLHRGKALDPKDIQALQEADDGHHAFADAARFLGYRTRSRMEIDRYLKKRGYSEKCRHTTVQRLEERGYVDDAEFARIHVKNRQRFKPRGIYVLRQELRQKGIDESIIDAVLAAVDEEKMAYRALRKKVSRGQKIDTPAQKLKVMRFLYGRGFPYETARHAFSRIQRQLSFPEKDGL